MESYTTFIIIAISVITIIILQALFNNDTRIKRKIRKAPQKLISNFKNNDRAKIIGEIHEIGRPLFSPLSKRECIGYHVIVEQEKLSGDHGKWETIIDKKIINDFIIRDKGMNAIVRTKHVKSVIVKDQKFKSGFLNDVTPQLESFLNKFGKKSEGSLGFNKTLRYKEGILEKDELVAVFGKGTWKKTDELNLKSSSIKVLEISSDENEPVYLSDDHSTIKNN